jgi:hypothetical protein
MLSRFPLHLVFLSLPLSFAQTGLQTPLVTQCHPNSASKVACITKYLSVLPYHFFRPTGNASYGPTQINQVELPSAYSAASNSLKSADFLVFDKKRGLELLGANPTYEYIFHVSDAVHEAPVYWEAGNKLFLSQLAPPAGYLPQLVVDLAPEAQSPEGRPTLSEYLSDPPVYAPNGGTWHNGLIYWGASGGNLSIGGVEQRPGIRTLDPATNKSVTLLNSFFGFYFNTVDDLAVDAKGRVWFTDPRKFVDLASQ